MKLFNVVIFLGATNIAVSKAETFQGDRRLNLFSLQLAQIYFDTCQILSNPKYSLNVTMRVFNDSDQTSRLNASAFLKNDLKKMVVGVALKGRNPGDLEYTITRFQGSIDLCNVQKGVMGNFLIKATAPIIEKYSNFKLECHVNKGFYYAENLPSFDLKSIPQFILRANPSERSDFELLVIMKGKVNKKLEHLITAKIYGVRVLI
jgi:hypothetical protein